LFSLQTHQQQEEEALLFFLEMALAAVLEKILQLEGLFCLLLLLWRQ
jgi:hypothetical protein